MLANYLLHCRLALAIAISWAIAGTGFQVTAAERRQPAILNPIALAQRPETSLQSTLPAINYVDVDLSDRGRPSRRKGGASRGSCGTLAAGGDGSTPSQLTALVPEHRLGLTASGHPTFWFYIPFAADDFYAMEFAVYGDGGDGGDDEIVYQATYAANAMLPGVVSVSLPTTQEVLNVGQEYEWELTIYCENPEDNPYGDFRIVHASGWIQRVAPNPELQKNLQAAPTERDRLIVLVDNGFWYDALTSLGNLYRADSQNSRLAKDWMDLLEDVNLSEVATEPLVSCCTQE